MGTEHSSATNPPETPTQSVPEIVVLIPHYNNLSGLERSLASIYGAEPVDVLIVDDGSRDRPDADALRKKNPQLPDISCILMEVNEGIEHALNRGLTQIFRDDRYRYIARLDCGDRCAPERFVIQRRFLDSHPEVALVGSWVTYVDMAGHQLFTGRFPEDDESIRKGMFVNSMFCHPSVMFRSTAAREVGLYDTDCRYAEDYAYFFRFIKKFRAANIGQALLAYEVDPEGISRKKHREQVRSKMRVLLRNWQWHPRAVWALFRNVALYAAPVSLLTALKKVLLR